MNPEALSIGEFSRRSRLPISTLRYYHELGVLEPAEVDPSSGYRRYSVDQLDGAALIARLRAANVSPEIIGAIVAAPHEASALLANERDRINRELDRHAGALRLIDEIDRDLVTPAPRSDIELRSIEPRRVTSHLGHISSDRAVADTKRLMVHLRRLHPPADGATYGACFALDLEHDPFEAHVFHTTPPRRGGTTLPGGDHLQLTTADIRVERCYADLLEAAARRDLTPVGPVIEHYHRRGPDIFTTVQLRVTAPDPAAD